jgi:hypothetical protein
MPTLALRLSAFPFIAPPFYYSAFGFSVYFYFILFLGIQSKKRVVVCPDGLFSSTGSGKPFH